MTSIAEVKHRRSATQMRRKDFIAFVFLFCVFIDDGDNEDDSNEAEQAADGTNKEDQADEVSGSVSAGEEQSMKDEDDEPTSGLSPLSDESKSQTSPQSDVPSPRHSPSQSEPKQSNDQTPLSNGKLTGLEEPVDSSNQISVVLVSTSKATKDPADVSVAANGVSVPLSPVIIVERCKTQTSNGTSPPPSPRTTRSHKRKREEITSGNPRNTKHTIIHDRYREAQQINLSNVVTESDV